MAMGPKGNSMMTIKFFSFLYIDRMGLNFTHTMQKCSQSTSGKTKENILMLTLLGRQDSS
jgi:hypothetical protein